MTGNTASAKFVVPAHPRLSGNVTRPVRWVLASALVAALSACATPVPPRGIQLAAEFDETHARKLIERGENTITGYAYINRGDGGFATCAGAYVELVPATEYAAERMAHIYGSRERGASSTGIFLFEPDPAEYTIVRRATTCDPQGRFEFAHVADGAFYLITSVWWEEADRQRGANLMRRVTTADATQQDVVLTRAEPSALDRALKLLKRRRDTPTDAQQ